MPAVSLWAVNIFLLISLSQDTHDRALKAAIEMLPSDISLITQSDYILSIVPPRDALSNAKRIVDALSATPSPRSKTTPLYYLDLNAISPRSAREIHALFQTSAPAVKFIDGGIIGSPPALKGEAWKCPSIPLSGKDPLSSAPISGEDLFRTLNAKHISPDIGVASGLKCCFASISKGYTALCIQAFTTASNLGVLEHLKTEIGERTPGNLEKAVNGVTSMPPKAYRWVKEMDEIAVAHAEEGGFEGGKDGEGIFGEIAKVYRSVAEDTLLGEEKTDRRKRGLTVEDVAGVMAEGLLQKRRKANEDV
jgi:3-hydroxyisobutyrate dehydrogenase-like beta-hydroxyacid dehydrogenase